MKKVQLNFTERAAQCVTSGTVFKRTTTELYDLYSHPEDIQLFIEIIGDDEKDQPSVYIDDISLKDLRYILSQLTHTALNNCIVGLRAYNGRPLQAFATVCEAQHEDFEVNGRSFKLCEFAERNDNISIPLDDILVIHEEEVVEMFYKIMNIINNDNK